MVCVCVCVFVRVRVCVHVFVSLHVMYVYIHVQVCLSVHFCAHFCDYLYGWIKKKPVTCAQISPKMVSPRDIAGNA